MIVNGFSIARTLPERVLDYLRFRMATWRLPRPRRSREDWDPPLSEVILLACDD